MIIVIRIFGFVAALVVLGFGALTPASAQSSQCSMAPGAVVQLTGTPHLFVADSQGVLHWGGDTRGFAGKFIDWNNRCSVGLDALRAMPRGDPYLSSGLPKIGDPIYLSKWEDSEASPTLLHILSIADVELFGINERNYGNFVLDRAVWEQRYGFNVTTLRVGPLASAASFAWAPADQSSYSQLLENLTNIETTALFRAVQSGTAPEVILPRIADCERSGLENFDRTRNAGTALSTAQDCLNRLNLGGGGVAPTPPPSTGVPPAPTNVRAIPLGGNVIRLTWNDVPNEIGYRIYGGDQQTPSNTFVTSTPPNVISVDVPGRLPNTVYCYAVSAFNTVGESIAAGPACTTSSGGGGGMPGAPINVTVTQLPSLTSQPVIRVDWIDTAFNENGFQIIRNDQVIGTVPANTITYTDTSASPTGPTCYRVAALTDQGPAVSEQACLGGGGGTAAPSAPTNLRVIVLAPNQGVQLNWTDTSNNEAGFQILRDDQLIDTVGTNVTTYVDSKWSPAAPSCYRVVAFNNVGTATSPRVCPGA